LAVKPGESVENPLALECRVDPDKTAIASRPFFADQPSPLRPFHQSDNGVVSCLQKLRQLRNGRPTTSRVTRDTKQQLVLLWRQPASPRRLLAEAQKAPQLVTKSRETSDHDGKLGPG
jgi:hypothetical protein